MISSEDIFKLLEKIPAGKVTTYKALAMACGHNLSRSLDVQQNPAGFCLNPKAARAVGRILNSNKNLITIPCHRVVKSNGEVGGYALGTEKKIELLKKEGVEIKNGKVEERFIISNIN